MKVYVDVSNFISVDFMTGIQRFVREILIRLLQNPDLDMVLLNCPKYNEDFTVLDNERFLAFYRDQSGEGERLSTSLTLSLDELEPGAVFFDIDSVWLSHLRRSAILPLLKSRGLKLAVYVQDIIPIDYPQYCHDNTGFFFMGYIAANLQYTDLLLTSTESTLQKIHALSARLNLPPVNGVSTWLGADFTAKTDGEEPVSKEAKDIASKGKYILCVGTIEARKNHQVLLDAYDAGLSDLGINLVFAGKPGWKVEELMERMENHPKKGKGFYYLEGQNDATIDYLYRHAYLVAFASFEEGFGLPIIEAIERGSLPVVSAIPVLQEVGGDFCDYFDPHSPEEFISVVKKYLDNPSLYEEKKEHLKDFVPVTWDTVAERITTALETLKSPQLTLVPEVKQMVVLSARPDALLESLPFVEYYMDFIKELVVCCPDKVVDYLRDNYKGRLKLTFLPDSEALNGDKLPEDHVRRNFFLRCHAMRSPKIDDQFIMGDDDYRPLKKISIEDYIRDNKYFAYYSYDLDKWSGTAWNMTSFDLGMKRTDAFLHREHYPTKLYASHMPQIINKQVFLEMLGKHPTMPEEGYCEWCVYFNYLQYAYPDNVRSVPHKTMGWPGNPTDWKLQVVPEEFLFENFYEQTYEKGGIFEGFSRTFSKAIPEENKEKIRLFTDRQNRYLRYQNTFDVYARIYASEYREDVRFGIRYAGGEYQIVLPRYVVMEHGGFAKTQFEIRAEQENDATITIDTCCTDAKGRECMRAAPRELSLRSNVFEFPLYGCPQKGTYVFHLKVSDSKRSEEKEIPMLVI